MNFYFFQLGLFLCYSVFFYFINDGKKSRLYYFIIWLQFSLLMGMRSSSIGSDTQMYVNSYIASGYTNISDNSTTYVFDLLSKTVSYITNGNYHVFLLILSTITVGCFTFFAYKVSNNYFESFMSIYIYITYYYYFNSFDVQRQMFAVSLSMIATYFLINNRHLWSLVFLILAIEVHNTAFVCIICGIVWVYKKGKKEFYTSIVASLVSLLFVSKILHVFSKFSSHYTMYENTLSSFGANGGTIILGVVYFVIVIFTLNTISQTSFNNNILLFLVYIVGIGAVLYIAGAKQQLLVRMADYFCIYAPILLPKSIHVLSARFKEKKIVKLFFSIGIIMLGLMIMYYKLAHNMGDIIPYT